MLRRGLYLTLLIGLLATITLLGGVGSETKDASASSLNGLEARYFKNENLTALKLKRKDRQINFNWGTRTPVRNMDAGDYSVRWSGKISPPKSGTYTFFADTTGGVRLWVGGKRLVDEWKSTKSRRWSGKIYLESGKLYPVKMEYTKRGKKGEARLLWSTRDLSRRLVSGDRLYLPSYKLPPTEEPPVDPPTDEPPITLPEGAELWSDSTTWGDGVPQSGDAVTVPSGKTIVLDRSTPNLKSLQVNGTLIFADRDLELKAGWIMVHGKLQIGTEEEPFTNDARITLTASNKSEDVMGMGTKFIGVMGGNLELHGKSKNGWTRLVQTAGRGATSLTLEDASTWERGDRITIASTDYDSDQAEDVTIRSISGNTVTLDRPLKYQHWGRIQTYDGKTIDERAEVGLLSRNIVIQGDEQSQRDGFGGHMMVMNGGQAHIEGAEITRMGQKSLLRRYPIHFHMLGDSGRESYVRDTSVHNTYNRCMTVHGTNYLNISGNVCSRNIGHAFFMEDGAEHGNVFQSNLGLSTLTPAAGEEVAAHDRQKTGPATYWITNPDNTYRDNVAAGSEGYGFWYAIPQHPTGLSADASVWPIRTPLKEFSGNVAHSNTVQGLRTHDSPNADGTLGYSFYSPHSDPANPQSEPVTANYEDFTAYKNGYHGAWLSGEYAVLSGAKLADNAIGATFASQEVLLKDSFVVGETENEGNPKAQEPTGLDGRSLPRPWHPGQPIIGYEFYDGNVGAQNVNFVNFNSNGQRRSGALGYTDATRYPVDARNFSEGMSFSNANRVYLTDPVKGMDGDASKVFLDKDGTVSGKAGSYVVADVPFLIDEDCTRKDSWNAYVCDQNYVGLGIQTLSSGPKSIKPLLLERKDGVRQSYSGCCDDSTIVQTSLISDEEYRVTFNGGLPSRTRYIMRPSEEGEATVALKAFGGVKVNNYNKPMTSVASMSALKSSTRTAYFYNSSTGTVYLKMVSNGYWDVVDIEAL